MREGFFRVVDEKADSGLIAAEQGSNALKNILQRKADSGLIAAEQGSNALKNILQEKSDGGEMRKGVGSLSEIARRMNEGGEANIDTRSGQEVRQSIRDALKNLNDTEIQDQWGKSRKELKTALDMLILQEYHGEYEPPVTQGVGSLSETARRMNEGGPSSIDDEVNAIVPSVIMAESSNDPKAVSEDGAIGLMQVLPSTAMKPGYGLPTIFELAREQGFVVDEETPETATQLLFMPDLNVEFGSRYLKAMRNEYDTMEDALRAYNAGPGNFNDYLAKGRDLSALDDEAVQYPLRVAAAGQGINPNEPAQYEAFTDSPEAFSTFMNMASEERPPAPRPRARPSVTYDGPRPMQRPTLPQDAPQQQMIKQAVQEVVQPQSLREKYSPQGIEQMLTGTIGEPLLPRQFQQGSPYPSMQ